MARARTNMTIMMTIRGQKGGYGVVWLSRWRRSRRRIWEVPPKRDKRNSFSFPSPEWIYSNRSQVDKGGEFSGVSHSWTRGRRVVALQLLKARSTTRLYYVISFHGQICGNENCWISYCVILHQGSFSAFSYFFLNPAHRVGGRIICSINKCFH